MPLALARTIQAGLPAMDFAAMPQVAGEVAWEEQIGNSLVVREPVGVVGIIPLELPTPPALRQGRSGACRRLLGRGEAERGDAAELLHARRDRLYSICRRPASTWSPASAPWSVRRSPPTTGSTWSPSPARPGPAGGSRGRRRHGEGLARARGQVGERDSRRRRPEGGRPTGSPIASSTPARPAAPTPDAGAAREAVGGGGDRGRCGREAQPGDPFEPSTRLGPLVSEAQRDRVRSYIEKGTEEGAKLVTGGVEPPEGPRARLLRAADRLLRGEAGDDDRPGEIFGPVLSIIPYDSEDEAAEIANSTIYGLDGSLVGRSGRAKAMARRMRTGQVRDQRRHLQPVAPFGGCKQSGHGRELGRASASRSSSRSSRFSCRRPQRSYPFLHGHGYEERSRGLRGGEGCFACSRPGGGARRRMPASRSCRAARGAVGGLLEANRADLEAGEREEGSTTP